MKLYNRGKTAAGLICIALSALMVSAGVNAKEASPLAQVMRSAPQQSTIDQASGVSNARLLKLLEDRAAYNRGPGVCGDSSPDAGEQCDDGNVTPGDGCDATCQVEAGSDCTAAIAGVDSINIIDNGNFEDGPVVWTETTTGITFGPISSPLNCGGCNLASDGEWWVWMGGWPLAATTSSVDQDVVIPTNATTMQLDIWEGNCIPDNGTGDFVSVRIDGTEVFNTGTCTTEGFYAQADTTISLTGAAAIAACGGTGCNDGASHNIEIYSEMDLNTGDSQTGSILIDNVRLNTPLVPPIDPIPSSCYLGVCGDSIVSDGEGCDDGNTDDFDGCSSSCQVEELTHICFNDLADTGFGVASGALAIANDIVDGSLEQGAPNPDWVEDGTEFAPICSEAFCGAALADDGDFFAWFGGSDMPNEQTLTQSDVTISTAASALTFQFLVGVCDSASDVIRVNIDGSPIWERFCTEDTPAYQTVSVDLTSGNPLAVTACGAGGCNDGLAHTVQFHGETFAAAGGNSNHFVDDIRIEYGVSPDRDANPSVCIELDGICSTPVRGVGSTGFGIEQFEAGLGIMSTFELGTLSGPVEWTTTDDEWTVVGDPSGCGSDLTGPDPVANWSGGNRTGGSGEAACADADGGAESLADPDATTACINAVDPTLSCQTKTYLCTPGLDTTNMTDPGVTATVHYQTATQDFDTPDFDDDEIFQVLVGEFSPNPFSISNYRSAGVVIDHNSATTLSSGPLTIGVNLDDFRNPDAEVQGCVDELEDPPCDISGVIPALAADNLHVCFLYAGIFSWWGQVDNVASRANSCTSGDVDFDQIPDDVDNCKNVANADQYDSNGDDIGSRCDADVTGPGDVEDCFVNFLDLNAMRAAFFTNPASPAWNPDLDFTGINGTHDDIINFLDLNVMRVSFFMPPGPSANGCDTLP